MRSPIGSTGRGTERRSSSVAIWLLAATAGPADLSRSDYLQAVCTPTVAPTVQRGSQGRCNRQGWAAGELESADERSSEKLPRFISDG